MDAQAPPLEILILTGQVCDLGVKFFKAFQVILICNQSQESLVWKLPQCSIDPTSLTLDIDPQMAHIKTNGKRTPLRNLETLKDYALLEISCALTAANEEAEGRQLATFFMFCRIAEVLRLLCHVGSGPCS